MALSNLQLTPQFVQAVREAVDILEIAGAHAKLQRVGRKWKALCPFHKEKTPSFQLDPEQSTSAIIVPHPEAKYFNAT